MFLHVILANVLILPLFFSHHLHSLLCVWQNKLIAVPINIYSSIRWLAYSHTDTSIDILSIFRGLNILLNQTVLLVQLATEQKASLIYPTVWYRKKLRPSELFFFFSFLKKWKAARAYIHSLLTLENNRKFT